MFITTGFFFYSNILYYVFEGCFYSFKNTSPKLLKNQLKKTEKAKRKRNGAVEIIWAFHIGGILVFIPQRERNKKTSMNKTSPEKANDFSQISLISLGVLERGKMYVE